MVPRETLKSAKSVIEQIRKLEALLWAQSWVMPPDHRELKKTFQTHLQISK